MIKQWYIIYIRENKEERVQSWLDAKGIENYYPFVKKPVKRLLWNKLIKIPIIPSKIFIKICPEDLPVILRNDNVINTVFWRDCPIVVDNNFISRLKLFVRRHKEIEVIKTRVSKIDFNNREPAADIIVKDNKITFLAPKLGILLSSVLDKDEDWTIYDVKQQGEEIGLKGIELKIN